MQWGQIKTLFILSFLILNIYLLIQFSNKLSAADIPFLENDGSDSIEETLQSENIKYPSELSQEITELNYITAAQRKFTQKEISELNKKDNLEAITIEGNFLVGQFEEPIPVPADATEETITPIVQPYVVAGAEYAYWQWNKDLNIIMFSQEKDDHIFYRNQDALLLFYLNSNNEITHFTQTMLGETEEQKKETIIQPINAIYTLYDRGHLSQDEEVTDIELGYLSRIQSEESQVFAPTWKITIKNENTEDDYFVNAIEGLIYTVSDREFLKETLDDYIYKKLSLPSDSEVKRSIVNTINQRLETENRSET